MRKRFDEQKSLFTYDIATADIPTNSQDSTPAMFAAIKQLWVTPRYKDRVLELLDQSLSIKKSTGPNGLDLWQIFVLAQCRLCLNISYSRLHYMASHDILLRHLLGIRDIESKGLIKWGYQRIYDNVTLLSDEVLKQINVVIVQMGHDVFKKKEEAALDLKTDSFPVQSNVHFPTDYGLLWDCARKCLDTVDKILKENPQLKGWRKISHWRRAIKNLSRALGQSSKGGGKNKEDRVIKATTAYIDKCTDLYNKLKNEVKNMSVCGIKNFALQMALTKYMSLMHKHIDLVSRRLLKGEKIQHEEKLFSIFEQYTQWLSKGKRNPELGKNLSITTDQYHLIVDYHIMESQTDSQIVIPLANRIISQYKVGTWSFDKGYWHQDNKTYLINTIDYPIMPKKGKCNEQEKQYQSSKKFKKLRNQHSAIESNINELEHRGLHRCPDRSYANFKRYISLGVLAYNIHKIGKEILRLEKTKIKQERIKQQLRLIKSKANIAKVA